MDAQRFVKSHIQQSMRAKLHFAHLVLILLLLAVLILPVSASTLTQTSVDDAQGSSASDVDTVDEAEVAQKVHRHQHKRKEMELAPVENTGVHPQAQGGLPLATPEAPANSLYLPLIQGGSHQAEVEAAAVIQKPVDLKVLVIAADGNETDYPHIIAALKQVGIPYTVLLAAQTPLTSALLSSGTVRGFYSGIILTTGNLTFFNTATQQWESAFTQAEWDLLWQYEANFGVRQVTSYTYPGGWPDNYGLNLATYQVATDANPLYATLTQAGKQVFADLNPNIAMKFSNTWVYLATIANTNVTTPLLVSGNYAIASINNYPNGRQNLAITAGNNPYLLHSMLLSYGMLNWLTRGLFLGERHVYIGPQVDDLLIDSDMWDTANLTDTTGLLFRMNAADYLAVMNWQSQLQTTYPLVSTLKLEWAFNGEGASGIYEPDTLTPFVSILQNQIPFNFVSHTFTHANLDAITRNLATSELQLNHQAATTQLRLPNYFKDSMVQPDISGLYNTNFHRAARDFGIKYLISDTSRPGWNNPSPNAGFYSTFQPTILIIPRRPTNLFYNLRTPAEWESEYNCFYGPAGTCAGGQFRYWDHNLSYAEILDKESDLWLQYLLKWDIDPLMFHQANTGTYNGVNTLLGDLVNATVAKYSAVYNLPIVGVSQHAIGLKMANRMTYNASGVRATWTPCQSLSITTTKAALIPLTGIGTGSNQETYGGQKISYIQLNANRSVTIPAPIC